MTSRVARPAGIGLASWTLALFAVGLLGCASDQDAAGDPASNSATPTIAAPALAPDEPAVIHRVGVEVRSWVINEREDDIARVLRSVENAQPERASAAEESWKRAGFRVLRVSRSDLVRLQAELSPRVGQFSLDKFEPGQRVSSAPIAVQRQWLEQGARWSVAARGPELDQGGIVGLSDSRVALPPGVLRMLARCWPVPVPGDSGVEAEMRIQLVPQHADGRVDAPDLLAPRTTTTDATQEGLVFRRLLLTLTLRAGEAVLIVPESPGRSWQEQATPNSDTPASAPGATDPSAIGPGLTDAPSGPAASEPAAVPIAKLGEVRRDTPGDRAAPPTPPDAGKRPESTRGPVDGPVRSIGEEMLSARGGAGGARVLIALVPELGRAQRPKDPRPSSVVTPPVAAPASTPGAEAAPRPSSDAEP